MPFTSGFLGFFLAFSPALRLGFTSFFRRTLLEPFCCLKIIEISFIICIHIYTRLFIYTYVYALNFI